MRSSWNVGSILNAGGFFFGFFAGDSPSMGSIWRPSTKGDCCGDTPGNNFAHAPFAGEAGAGATGLAPLVADSGGGSGGKSYVAAMCFAQPTQQVLKPKCMSQGIVWEATTPS